VVVREDEGRVGLEHALHLPEEPGRVVDLGDRRRAEHDVDRLGAEEGELGQIADAPLDLHLGLERALARSGEVPVGAVEGDDDRATARERHRGIAGPEAEVEHALASHIADELQRAFVRCSDHARIIARDTR
jgi:hypothetical protein